MEEKGKIMINDDTAYRYNNIHNLEYGQYEGSGLYDIPMMLPVHIDNLADIPVQGFSYAMSDKNRAQKGCHFFQHDYQFERVWTHPQRYMQVLREFAFVLSPDFSPYSDMPKATKIFNVYRNRWCGRYWQENGIKVIPTVTWSDEESLEYALDGIPKHSTVAISTVGEGRWSNWKMLYDTWDLMLEKLEPDTILLYGKDLRENLKGNIVFKKMISDRIAVTDRS